MAAPIQDAECLSTTGGGKQPDVAGWGFDKSCLRYVLSSHEIISSAIHSHQYYDRNPVLTECQALMRKFRCWGVGTAERAGEPVAGHPCEGAGVPVAITSVIVQMRHGRLPTHGNAAAGISAPRVAAAVSGPAASFGAEVAPATSPVRDAAAGRRAGVASNKWAARRQGRAGSASGQVSNPCREEGYSGKCARHQPNSAHDARPRIVEVGGVDVPQCRRYGDRD